MALDEAFLERMDRLMTLMEKNEHDRELSTVWKWGDGRMMNRAEYEALQESDRRAGYPLRAGFNVDPT